MVRCSVAYWLKSKACQARVWAYNIGEGFNEFYVVGIPIGWWTFLPIPASCAAWLDAGICTVHAWCKKEVTLTKILINLTKLVCRGCVSSTVPKVRAVPAKWICSFYHYSVIKTVCIELLYQWHIYFMKKTNKSPQNLLLHVIDQEILLLWQGSCHVFSSLFFSVTTDESTAFWGCFCLHIAISIQCFKEEIKYEHLKNIYLRHAVGACNLLGVIWLVNSSVGNRSMISWIPGRPEICLKALM